MFQRLFGCLLSIGVVCCLAGCGESKKAPKNATQLPPKQEVIPVKGVIHVNGAAGERVHCRLVPIILGDGIESPNVAGEMIAISNIDGEFNFRKYEGEDGVPAGKYFLTFTWPTMSMSTRGKGGLGQNDQLKGKYASIDGNTQKVVVEQGKPVDLGTIELKN